MKNATLRQLTVFETVARYLNFTRAAETLGVTQAAVSIQIKQLEENLGVALFEQLGKRIYLTEAGRDLAEYCRRIGQQLNEAETVLERHRGSQGGQLVLCIGRTAKYFVPQLLAAFRQHRNGFSVNLSVAGREELLARLAENACDMAIMGRPYMGDECVSEAFLDDPLVVIAPADHPLAAQRAVSPQRLSQEPFIMREPGSETRDLVERYFASQGISPTVCMVTDSNEAIKRAVQVGLGVAIVPLHSIALEVKAKHLVVLDVEGMPRQRSWYLVHRTGKRFSRVAEAFKDFVLREARNYIQDDPAEPGRPGIDTLAPGSSVGNGRTGFRSL